MNRHSQSRVAMSSSVAAKPRVTVVLLTYNHGPFIAQAIESVLMQRVRFPYEVVVVEDCSTDATREILLDYQGRHPDLFRLVLAETNQNDNRAWGQAILEAKGEYVALLDGDDYWTSADKLQRQVDFLDGNPAYVICFHNVEVVYSDGSKATHPFHLEKPVHYHSRGIPKPTSSLEDVVPGNFMQTASVMFRNKLFERFPEWFYEMPVADWPLHVLNAQYGRIGYLGEMMAAYRVHPRGLWSANMSRFDSIDKVNQLMRAYKLIDAHFDGRFRTLIHARSRWLFEAAAQLLYAQGRTREGNDYILKYLSGLPRLRWLAEKKLLLRMIRANVPGLRRISGWLTQR